MNAAKNSTNVIREVKQMMPCTATFSEAMGMKGNVDPSIKPVAPGTIIVGFARTAETAAGDNLALHHALLQAEAGEVIVADCKARSEYGHWGEFMSTVAMDKGVEGIVVDGGVRDVAVLRKLKFGVFARGVSVMGTSKKSPGTVNRPVMCGGVQVSPGDLVLGDDDGVVVVPSGQIDEVLSKAKRRTEDEKATLQSLKAGRMAYSEFMKKKGWL
jgi:4-hydroxy-4-methyl-2-oxoglutarate aldolase